jgi:hypothetical protein
MEGRCLVAANALDGVVVIALVDRDFMTEDTQLLATLAEAVSRCRTNL